MEIIDYNKELVDNMDSSVIFNVGVRFARVIGLLSGIVQATSFFISPFAFSIFSFSTNLDKNLFLRFTFNNYLSHYRSQC